MKRKVETASAPKPSAKEADMLAVLESIDERLKRIEDELDSVSKTITGVGPR